MKTHRPYRPGKKELAERRKYRRGHRMAWEKGQAPTYEPKTVATKKCVVCGLNFTRLEVICNRCGNCQACGGLAADRFDNICHQCGNHIDQPRYDTLGPTYFA